MIRKKGLAVGFAIGAFLGFMLVKAITTASKTTPKSPTTPTTTITDPKKIESKDSIFILMDSGVSSSSSSSPQWWLSFDPKSIEKGLKTAIGKPVTYGYWLGGRPRQIGQVIELRKDGKLLAKINKREYRDAKYSERWRKQQIELLRVFGRDVPDDYVLQPGDGKWIRQKLDESVSDEAYKKDKCLFYHTKVEPIIDRHMGRSCYRPSNFDDDDDDDIYFDVDGFRIT